MTERIDWAVGDLLGLRFPARAEVLRQAGAEFLTLAFHAAGALSRDNRVVAVKRQQPFSGGSTGQKMRLSVEYLHPVAGLHRDLFVKFSRDYENAQRDRARFQMEREARFALLSRDPVFPIEVPACYAADFHQDSGTGFMISAEVPFGVAGVEPQREKCMDGELPDSLPYYRCLVQALGRLAGTQRSGRLGDDIEKQFPFDSAALAVSTREHYSAEQVARRVERYSHFAACHPRLFPEHLRCQDFIKRLTEEAPRFIDAAPSVESYLADQKDYLALCHWNANIDNAWFWRDHRGALQCGLFDWGNVSVMPVAMALWGCLSGAEIELWDNHLEELLSLFVQEIELAGGPGLEPATLQRQLLLHARLMGINWLLDVPRLLQQAIPELASATRRSDPLIRDREAERTRLQMLTVFLNLWATRDPGPLPAACH